METTTPPSGERRIGRWILAAMMWWTVACAGEAESAEAPSGTPRPDALEPGSGSSSSPEGETPSTGLCPDDEADLRRPDNWMRDSHCPGVDADHGKVFDDTLVHRLDIEMSPEAYAASLADLDQKLGTAGRGELDGDSTPAWFSMTLRYDGQTWTDVGMRYKGNSSLRTAHDMGVRKYAFRLNLDMYADETPSTADQRFFGFKKMTFSNGFKDPSFLRDKVGADIFREGGVPAARGAFAAIFVDAGEGPTYWGMYTMVEDPSDEMLDAQFGDDAGNLYKPEGEGATWQRFVAEHFAKKTNEENPDWSDVETAMSALHAPRTDAATWRSGLETAFDVEAFLRCLSLNQTMVNWDSYGFMNHNYYVYADPTRDGRLVWFPWDLNESMLIMNVGGRPMGPPPGQPGQPGPPLPPTQPTQPSSTGSASPESVIPDGIGDNWPLISFLLEDTSYRERYRELLREGLDGSFAAEALKQRMQRYHDLVAPWVVGPEASEQQPYTFIRSSSEFVDSLDNPAGGLFAHVDARHEAVEQTLAQP